MPVCLLISHSHFLSGLGKVGETNRSSPQTQLQPSQLCLPVSSMCSTKHYGNSREKPYHSEVSNFKTNSFTNISLGKTLRFTPTHEGLLVLNMRSVWPALVNSDDRVFVFCRFLFEVQLHSKVNKMNVENLATVMGINLLKPQIEDPITVMKGKKVSVMCPESTCGHVFALLWPWNAAVKAALLTIWKNNRIQMM